MIMKLRMRLREIRRVKLYLRHLGPACSEKVVAEEIQQLPHVLRTEANPGRHQVKVWVKFPAKGLLGLITNAVKSCQCEMTGGEVR